MSTSLSHKQLAVNELTQELATTRRMLERLPDGKLDWTPHAKSMTLGRLAGHLTNLLYWQQVILEQDEFDLATVPAQSSAPRTRQEVLQLFDENVDTLQAVLADLEEAAFARPWKLRNGEHVIFSMPKAAVLRSMGFNHMAHHRGQLSVYLRLLDVAVPPSYGPTADEALSG